MSLKIGTTDVGTVKLGTSQVDAIYKGSDLVWQNDPTPTPTVGGTWYGRARDNEVYNSSYLGNQKWSLSTAYGVYDFVYKDGMWYLDGSYIMEGNGTEKRVSDEVYTDLTWYA